MSQTVDTSALRFEAAEHRYFLGERELPSVTTVLKEAGLIDESHFTEEAAARGTAVHRSIERLHASEPFLGIDAQYVGYIEAYIAFLAGSGFMCRLSEHRVCDADRGYAGTADLIGSLPGHPTVLIDVKTGSVPKSVGPQTYAYARCLETFHERFALRLTDLGSFRLEPLNDWRNDETDFLAALRLYHRTRTHYGTR